MRRYLKIALVCLSFLFVLQACSLRHHSNYKTSEAFSAEGKDFIADHFQKILFNTQIDAFGHEASGLLFVKLMGKEQYRFVFMSQVGLKFFDVEIDKGEFKVHQLISYLDKKNIRRVLENDLRLLIQEPLLSSSDFFTHKTEDLALLREKEHCRFRYYTYQQKQLLAKETAGFLFKNTTISYQYKGTGLPTEIIIEHAKFNLKWTLQAIKEQNNLDE
jgi:hypothetical protein